MPDQWEVQTEKPAPAGGDWQVASEAPAPPPSFYDKLTAVDQTTKNPALRFLSNAGASLIGAPEAAYNTIRHPIDTLFSAGGSLGDAINSYSDPEQRPTLRGAMSVLPESLGLGVGGAAGAELTGRAVGAPIAKGIKSILPSTQRAGATLESVKAAAGNVPLRMNDVGDTALDLYEQSQRGATMPKAARDLLNRTTRPDSPPINYAEGKDFQSNISRLSADEKMRLNPNTKRLVGQLNSNMKDSLREAADTKGMGAKFDQGMSEYRNAMRIHGFSDTAIDLAWKAALGALGIGAAKKLYESY